MYKLFKTNPEIFILKKMRIQGSCDYVNDIICLDYRKEILSTVCHEVLHYIYPAMTETSVARQERRIMNFLTPIQVKHILKNFSRIL